MVKKLNAPKAEDRVETDEVVVETASAPIVAHQKGRSLSVGGFDYTVETIVTRTVLKQEQGAPFFIQIESAMYEAPPLDTPSKMAPPIIMDVINLQTGECQIVICNTVLERELDRAYPNASYVGKFFAMSGHFAGRDQNDYRVYNIVELKPKA